MRPAESIASYPVSSGCGENQSPGTMADFPPPTPTDSDATSPGYRVDRPLRFPHPSAADAVHHPAMTEHPNSARIAEALGTGGCPPDSEFDQFLADPMRRFSAHHWTPLAVAAR